MAPSGILATMPLMEVRDPKQVGQTFLSATSPRVGAFLPPERTRIGLDELPLVSFSNPRRGACRIVRGGRNAAHSRFAGRHECLPHQMPFNFPNNFLARNGLYALAMARAFARFRDPRRRAIWWHRVEFYAEIDGECVIKPATGTGGGRGVTTGVRTVWQLGRAAAAAAVYGDTLLIEEQIGGDNYRLLYLDGELLDAFVRKPPTVIGDGRSTVARLLHAQNSDRLRHGSGQSQALLSIDLDMRRTLAKQKLSLRSVPARGMEVVLKTVVNDNCGIDNSNAARLLCPSIVEDAAKAVRALQIRLAGVDVITAAPTVPLAKSGGAILEVNAPPNFYYHYHKSDGACPVAVHVLRRLMKCESVHPLAQSL